jgi:hypothetical protein
MHRDYYWSQQIICPCSKNVPSKDIPLFIYQQLDEALGLAVRHSAFALAKLHASNLVLHILLA